MAKVITFSRVFPAYHPKAGQPTNFVEAIYKSLYLMKVIPKELEESYNHEAFINGFTKHHTIRSGNRFKKGDFFSPRVWGTDVNPKSGKIGAYHSKQIIIAPDTEILQTIDLEIDKEQAIFINGKLLEHARQIEKLANNDGLRFDDFYNWFNDLPFKGQIICWNPNINYNY
ncbi:hypothetical protein [Flavobacterium fluviatile]|uniref:hypothetical protein n=1 Tax=Flavobacterium fluviatile TaxID=1862387 RepID=UPI0013D74672|nr:hypothetical protein [Flavobacterium fluviatile]